MKNLRIALLLILVAVGMTACNDDLSDLKVSATPEAKAPSGGGSGDGGGSTPCPDC